MVGAESNDETDNNACDYETDGLLVPIFLWWFSFWFFVETCTSKGTNGN